MRKKRYAVFVSAVAALALLISACGGASGGSSKIDSTSTDAAAANPDGDPQPGGVYTAMSNSDTTTLDVQKSASAVVQIATSGIVYSKLLEYKLGPGVPYDSGEVTGDLAESWARSDDGLSWTIKLRHGVKFQNIAPVSGREFTSADVVCTIDRIKTLPGAQENLVDIVTSVTTPDAYTVVFKLSEPYAAFDESLASYYMSMLPCEGTRGQFDLATQAIGTGPFILSEWNRNVQRVYTKNPNYFIPGKPYVDAVKMVIVPDAANAVAGFRTGQLDSTGSVSKTTLPALMSTNPDTVVQSAISHTGVHLFMNQAVKPFDDLRVRKAVSMAVDWEAIGDTFRASYQLQGPVPPNVFGGLSEEEEKKLSPHDPAAAKKLMADAGYASGFSVKLVTTGGLGPSVPDEAQFIQEDLKAIGINVTLDVKDYASFYADYQAKTYEMGYYQSTGFMTADEFLTAFWTTSGSRNWFNLSDPKLDKMIADQRVIADRDQREKALQDISRYIDTNIVNPIHGFVYAGLTVYQPWVHDIYTYPEYASRQWNYLWLGQDAPGRK